MAKVKYVCTECGSEDVVSDAWASWDIETQQWVLEDTFDMSYCRSCESESNTGSNLKTEPIEETNTFCSVCHSPQFQSPGGITCSNGHGGADPAEEITDV